MLNALLLDLHWGHGCRDHGNAASRLRSRAAITVPPLGHFRSIFRMRPLSLSAMYRSPVFG